MFFEYYEKCLICLCLFLLDFRCCCAVISLLVNTVYLVGTLNFTKLYTKSILLYSNLNTVKLHFGRISL